MEGDLGPGAVVLTFDVCVPAMESSRRAMIKHRGEMIAELGGDGGGGAIGPDGGSTRGGRGRTSGSLSRQTWAESAASRVRLAFEVNEWINSSIVGSSARGSS